MKVAILLTGHFRGYAKVYNSFVDNVLCISDKHSVDVFIDTWETLHTNYSYAFLCKNDRSDTSLFLDVEDVKRKYNPRKINIDIWDKVKHKFLAQNFYSSQILKKLVTQNNARITATSTDPITIKDGYSLAASQFYKFYRCNLSRKEYEREQKIQYDIVIKTRPDILYIKKLNVDNFDSNRFYFNEKYGDIFIYSSGKQMDVYCNVLNSMKYTVDNHKIHPFDFNSPFHMYSVEFFEEWNLLDHGIKPGHKVFLNNCQIYRV